MTATWLISSRTWRMNWTCWPIDCAVPGEWGSASTLSGSVRVWPPAFSSTVYVPGGTTGPAARVAAP